MSRIRLRTLIVGICVAAGWTTVAHGTEDDVNVFFQTCMASLPTFAEVDKLLAPMGFEGSKETIWLRKSDGLGVRISEEADRYTCMILQTGNHSVRFRREVEKTLNEKFAGTWEQKAHQGRTLYLVRASNENVLIEVIPPFGASTILVANARKE